MNISINKNSWDKYMMVRVSPQEALSIIASLAEQIRTDNCNAGRPEILCHMGDFRGFVSIAVVHDDICVECGYDIRHKKSSVGSKET
jgi:hypothetical protein